MVWYGSGRRWKLNWLLYDLTNNVLWYDNRTCTIFKIHLQYFTIIKLSINSWEWTFEWTTCKQSTFLSPCAKRKCSMFVNIIVNNDLFIVSIYVYPESSNVFLDVSRGFPHHSFNKMHKKAPLGNNWISDLSLIGISSSMNRSFGW